MLSCALDIDREVVGSATDNIYDVHVHTITWNRTHDIE